MELPQNHRPSAGTSRRRSRIIVFDPANPSRPYPEMTATSLVNVD
jgi:hypothetical protein